MRIIEVCSLISVLILCVFSTHVQTLSDYAAYGEKGTIVSQDSGHVFLTLAAGALLLLLCAVIKSRIHTSEKTARRITIITVILCSIAALYLSFSWISLNDCPVIADQKSVYDAAVQVAEGQPVTNTDYFKLYANQNGMVLLESIAYRLFSFTGIQPVRFANALCTPAIITGLSLLAWLLSKNDSAVILTAVFSLLFLPISIYSTFVYGTIFSLMCIIIAFDGLLMLEKTSQLRHGIICSLFLILAYMDYQSSLIAVIAVLIVLFLMFMDHLHRKEGRMIAAIALTMVLIISGIVISKNMTFTWFRNYAGITTSDSIPASAWIRMGLTSTQGTNGPGSYDQYTVRLFSRYHYSEAESDAAARKDLAEIVKQYANGERDLSFFGDKISYQWTDSWFDALPMTIYYSMVSSSEFMNLLQSDFFMQYGMILNSFLILTYMYACIMNLILLIRPNNGRHYGQMIPLLYLTGGFVFQLFWEGKSRYCFPYIVVLIPAAVCAFCYISKAAGRLMHQKKTSESADE